MSGSGGWWRRDAAPGQIRVLHVDDDPDLAQVVATFLERAHDRIDVVTATSVREGLARLDDERIDCVVSDHDMPDRTGVEFLAAVRETDPDLPFILFTGKGSEEIASDAISAGVTDYLQKESGTDQYAILANRIANVVEQYRAQVAAERSERRLRELAENTPDVRWMFSTDWGDLLFVNSAYETVYGRPVDDLEGDPTTFLEAVHPDDRAAVEDAMATLADGAPVELEYRVNPDEDFQRWVWVHGKPIRDETGEVVRIVGFSRDVTDRKEREHDLERVETMVNAVGDSIYALDADGRFTDVNDHFVERTGYDRADVIGEHVSLVLDADAVAVGRDRVQALLADPDRQVASFETTITPATGDPYPIELHISLLPTDDGAFDGTVGVARDVTDRKERERELEQYEELVETMGEAVYVLDAEGRMREVNERMEQLTGYDRADLVGEHVSLVLDEDDIETGEQTIRTLLTSDDQSVGKYEETVYTADGRQIPCAVRQTLRPAPDGEFRGTVGTVRDVTDRQRHERKLTALHDVAVDLDASGSVEEVCERTVAASQDVLAFDYSAVLVEEGGSLVEKAVASAGDPDEPVAVASDLATATFRTGESRVVDDLADAAPGRSTICIPIGDHGVFQAVAAEPDAFEASDRELAELLLSHAESALDRLAQSRQLERQNERLAEFASVVTHEIRNPLNVLDGNLSLAAETGDPEYVEQCQRTVGRMERLVDDVLTLAREGTAPADRRPVDLARLGRECFQGVGAPEATLAVETDATVVADEDRLRRLLTNLFRNSVEHGSTGSRAKPDDSVEHSSTSSRPTADDSVAHGARDGQPATADPAAGSGAVAIRLGDLDDGFYVEDDGVGIPAEERESVFEAGYSTAERGTGFGLAIVQRIAQSHDWTVDVTDGSDGGVRFEFRGVETA
ncbi:MAG: PAS domain S-box protein [Haloarculaceae archaeon]